MFDLDLSEYIAAQRKLHAAAARYDSAVAAGVRRVAERVDRAAEREINVMYARRIPTVAQVAKKRNRSGKYNGKRGSQAAWTRTGNLKTGRIMSYPSATEARVSINGPAMKYAARRHQLGVSWTPRNPALGIVRRNPFFAEAVEKTAPQMPMLFKTAFLKDLRL